MLAVIPVVGINFLLVNLLTSFWLSQGYSYSKMYRDLLVQSLVVERYDRKWRKAVYRSTWNIKHQISGIYFIDKQACLHTLEYCLDLLILLLVNY